MQECKGTQTHARTHSRASHTNQTNQYMHTCRQTQVGTIEKALAGPSYIEKILTHVASSLPSAPGAFSACARTHARTCVQECARARTAPSSIDRTFEYGREQCVKSNLVIVGGFTSSAWHYQGDGPASPLGRMSIGTRAMCGGDLFEVGGWLAWHRTID